MSMLDFLIPPRLQRILSATLLNPERSYSVSELIRIADVGQGMGHRTIKMLSEAGIIIDRRMGNQRRFRANLAHPLYKELRAIMVKSFGVVEKIREKLAPVSEYIEQAFVFGSVAEMRDRPDSDIDLMVIGTPPTLAMYQIISELEKEFGRHVHLSLYAPGEWRQMLASDPVTMKINDSSKLWLINRDVASGGATESAERPPS